MKKHFPAALVAGVLLLAPALEAAEQLGAESPQAVVEKLRAAAVDENFGELAKILAPAAREEMAKGIWGGATMMIAMSSAMGDMAAGMGEAAGEETAEAKAQAAKAKAEAEAKFGVWKKRYDDLAKKHGLPTLDASEDTDPEAAFAKADHVGVIADFGNLLQSFGEEQAGQKKGEGKKIEGQLENLKVDGDKAEGMLGGDPISFVKIDGRWFIATLPQGEAPPEEG